MENQEINITSEEYDRREAVLNRLRCICSSIRKTMTASFGDICPGMGDRVADALASKIEDTERTLIYWLQKNAMKGGEE